MRSSKKASKPKAKRPRGRPTKPLVIDPADLEPLLDHIVRKKRPTTEADGPVVRSKKPPSAG